MLGWPPILFHKRSHGNLGCSELRPRHSASALHDEQHMGSFNLAGNLAGDQPPWLQHLFHGVKAIDANARSLLLVMAQRSMQPRRRKQQIRFDQCRLQRNTSTLCFASISDSLKHDLPQEGQVKLEELKDSAEQLGKDLRVPVPEANVPGVGDVRSLVLKQLLCGIVAGAVASFAVSPFQVLRTRVIAGRGGSSAAEVLGTVAHNEGMRSLMKGSLKITMLATSIQKGVQFTVYEAVKRKEQEKLGKDPKLVPAIFTESAGVNNCWRHSRPCVHIDDIPSQRTDGSPTASAKRVPVVMGQCSKGDQREWHQWALQGDYSSLTMIPQAAASFYTYETVKNYLNERANHEHHRSRDYLGTSAVSIGAGAAAGLVAAALTYPLEVVRKQISMSALPHGTVGIGGAMMYNNLPQALVGIAQREGLGGFYRGFVVQALQVIPMTALSFAIYEVAKRALVAENEERRDEVKG